MKKNDKIIVIAGVIILILAAIGIYYWVPADEEQSLGDINEFFSVSGEMSDMPMAITVPDTCPFYPLIATPIAVNFDDDGNQNIVPLFVENFSDLSKAVKNAKAMIDVTPDLSIDFSKTPKEVSLDLAKECWKSSEGALIIEYSQEGYCLGTIATPIASYLCIPVIVTDELDGDVTRVLGDLGVTHTIICGENIDGYGNYLKFENVEEIVDAQIELVEEKFGMVDYITLTNPIDAWKPKVLDSFTETYGPITVGSGASILLNKATSGKKVLGKFTIPEDYKYALIKFEGINLETENVDDFGDFAGFSIGANLPDIPGGLQTQEIYGGGTSGYAGDRDSNGNIVEDKVYVEAVVYDRGGTEYVVKAGGTYMLKPQGKIIGKVTVEKLENPIYPMMPQLSSLAPYLTAYHMGIMFGKPEFAFTADDHIITKEGSNSPGFWTTRRNAKIVDNANRHITDVIIDPLNEILADLANIELVDDRDIKTLRDYYADYPVYIALVGGAEGLPTYTYDNYMIPVDYKKGAYGFGVGTPSDVIYGNIDPVKYDWSNLANDLYSEYPFQENIVGRITGFDVQDASALIARSIFYQEIIEDLGDWKETFTVLIGEGMDFQQPILKFRIAKLLGQAHDGMPMKMWNGFAEISLRSVIEDLAPSLGFETINHAFKEEAMKQGFTDDELNRIKTETVGLNKLLFWTREVKKLVGDGNVNGGEYAKSANFILLNGHGNKNILVMDGIDLISAGIGGPIVHHFMKKIMEVASPYGGPGSSLGTHGAFNTREAAKMDFDGPSFIWLESCITGKFDGIYPKNSLGQAFLHSGVTSLVAAGTTTNIAGGYLEPKNSQWDNPLSVWSAWRINNKNADKGIFPDNHFGFKIYEDMCDDMKEDDSTVGMAFRNAKNIYLKEEYNWPIWWSPPLLYTGDNQEDIKLQQDIAERMKEQAANDKLMLKNKWTAYQEYFLFGDPALNLYMPGD
jgi:hypothetical protein